MFIWTVHDVIGAALIAAALLCFALYGCLVGIDKVQQKIKHWRKS